MAPFGVMTVTSRNFSSNHLAITAKISKVLLDFFHGGLKIIPYDHRIVAGINQLVAQEVQSIFGLLPVAERAQLYSRRQEVPSTLETAV